MPFLVGVVSYSIVVEFGVVQQSFPSFPPNWDPASVVLVQILAKIAWERKRNNHFVKKFSNNKVFAISVYSILRGGNKDKELNEMMMIPPGGLKARLRYYIATSITHNEIGARFLMLHNYDSEKTRKGLLVNLIRESRNKVQ